MFINLQWSRIYKHVHSSCSAFFRSHLPFCHLSLRFLLIQIPNHYCSLVEDRASFVPEINGPSTLIQNHFWNCPTTLAIQAHQVQVKAVHESTQNLKLIQMTAMTVSDSGWLAWYVHYKKKEKTYCARCPSKNTPLWQVESQNWKNLWILLLRLRLNIRCQPQKGYTIHLWTDRWPGSTGLMRMITTYLHLLYKVQYHDQRFLWWGWTPDAYRKTSNYIPKISTFQHVEMRRDK